MSLKHWEQFGNIKENNDEYYLRIVTIFLNCRNKVYHE